MVPVSRRSSHREMFRRVVFFGLGVLKNVKGVKMRTS